MRVVALVVLSLSVGGAVSAQTLPTPRPTATPAAAPTVPSPTPAPIRTASATASPAIAVSPTAAPANVSAICRFTLPASAYVAGPDGFVHRIGSPAVVTTTVCLPVPGAGVAISRNGGPEIPTQGCTVYPLQTR